jgi:hypothetical protein
MSNAARRRAHGHKTIRYTCPTGWSAPPLGLILMGEGPRTRRAYRVLGTRPGLSVEGNTTWRLAVEAMSAARGREEIAQGVPTWSIVWEKRIKKTAGLGPVH